ncbi:hypothetical protein PLICRDRAFT_63270, partial [Plicaturopsis crispa FD-325 SS-3]
PPYVQLSSTNNTPIESFWRWKRNGEGHTLKHVILAGTDSGIFCPVDEIHVQVFNWLWPPLVQERLDEFREYWNNHRLSRSKTKILPTGKSPRHMLTVPKSVRLDARDCSVYVNPATVHDLRQ